MTNNHGYSSVLPMDMGQLESITEGKATYNEELLDLFFLNVDECLSVLEKECANGESEKWKNASEELKDISDRLGALELSKVCAVSGKLFDSDRDEKKKMVENIQSNVHKLRVFVRSTRY